MSNNKYDQFVNISYSGRELLKKHSLNESGTWRVHGEDPNCDWGGWHDMPFIGTFEGKLENVIRQVVEMPGFWQHGAGGKIEKVNVIKDTGTTNQIMELRNQCKVAQETLNTTEQAGVLTMNKKYDLVVFIGRFQIVHNAHMQIIKNASQMANKVLVIVGSADKPRTYKNPFSFDERKAMLQQASEEFGVNNMVVGKVNDHTYNDMAWAAQVQRVVTKHAETPWSDYPKRIALIGHKKDDSSFYLNFFPQWNFIDQDLAEPLDATQVRDLYFNRKMNMNYIRGVVPNSVVNFLVDFKTESNQEYEQVIREKEFIEKYKKQYEHLPYAPTFVTTDAVVVQSGHVLMIRRRSEPGKGLWAFPGGFLNAKTDRSLVDAMIRELREETGLKIPEKVLKGSITNQRTFDAIDRSARGRTITTAFKVELDDTSELPKVKGMDDAEKAKWIPISEVKRNECFEDHFDILEWAIGGI